MQPEEARLQELAAKAASQYLLDPFALSAVIRAASRSKRGLMVCTCGIGSAPWSNDLVDHAVVFWDGDDLGVLFVEQEAFVGERAKREVSWAVSPILDLDNILLPQVAYARGPRISECAIRLLCKLDRISGKAVAELVGIRNNSFELARVGFSACRDVERNRQYKQILIRLADNELKKGIVVLPGECVKCDTDRVIDIIPASPDAYRIGFVVYRVDTSEDSAARLGVWTSDKVWMKNDEKLSFLRRLACITELVVKSAADYNLSGKPRRMEKIDPSWMLNMESLLAALAYACENIGFYGDSLDIRGFVDLAKLFARFMVNSQSTMSDYIDSISRAVECLRGDEKMIARIDQLLSILVV